MKRVNRYIDFLQALAQNEPGVIIPVLIILTGLIGLIEYAWLVVQWSLENGVIR